jgi:hypothetical protein
MSETTKTKVFAVSAGKYSDWRIESLHWTKKEAEASRDEQAKRYAAYQEDYKGGWVDEPNNNIEEFEIDGQPPPALLMVWNKLVQS